MKELGLILAKELQEQGIKKLTDIDPNSPLADKVHHAQVYGIFEKVFKKISNVEGKLFTFSFKIQNGFHVFTVLKSVAEELGLKKNIYRGKLWDVFIQVMSGIDLYRQRTEKKPS